MHHKDKKGGCGFQSSFSAKDSLIKYKCLSFNEDYSNKIDKELKTDSRTRFLITITRNSFCC